MEENTLTITAQNASYQSLVGSLGDLQQKKQKLDAYLALLTQTFSEIEQFMQNWGIGYNLDAIVEDVNTRLGEFCDVESGEHLMDWLKDSKSKVEELETSLHDLEKEYDKMKQKPDRHGKGTAEQKTELFLKSLNQLHIAQIRETVDETIPRLFSEIQAVLKAFELENDKQAANMELATKLLERMDGYHDYADKFNVFNICDSCRPRVKAVMQSPDIDPEKDTVKLMAVQKELDALDAKFAEEQRLFDELMAKINGSKEAIWEEDYNWFNQIYEKKICMVVNTIDSLRSSYEICKQQKRNDIIRVSAPYKRKKYTRKTFPVRCKKILEHISGELNNLSNNFTSKNDLNKLVSDIDAYIRERKREIRRKFWGGLFKSIYWIVAGVFILIFRLIKAIRRKPHK